MGSRHESTLRIEDVRGWIGATQLSTASGQQQLWFGHRGRLLDETVRHYSQTDALEKVGLPGIVWVDS